MISAKFTRSEQILDRAVNRGFLTEHGKAAVIAAMDPFHDKPIEDLRGWPDMSTGPSVVRTVKSAFDITLAGTEDTILIYSFPIMNNNLTRRVARRCAIVDLITDGVSTNFQLASLVAVAYTGPGPYDMTNGRFLFNTSIPATWLGDVSRTIGKAFEVHNTTADLYKQGTITVFEVPQSTQENETYFVKSLSITPARTIVPTPVECYPIKKWPNSVAQAMLLPGTRQWEAGLGCYVIIPFSGRDNFANQPDYKTPAVYADSAPQVELPINLNTAPFNIGQFLVPVIDNDPLAFLANKFDPMHSRGVLITGQSVNSKFTVNFIQIVESFPSMESELVTLARPSACHDAIALEMISCASRELPVGVPVSENGLGDWFAEVVAEIAPVVGAIGSGLGIPLVSAAAAAAEAAAKTHISGTTYTPTGGFFDRTRAVRKPRQKKPQPARFIGPTPRPEKEREKARAKGRQQDRKDKRMQPNSPGNQANPKQQSRGRSRTRR